ncbi:MAG: PD-(D/E)XK nuclease family protein [Chromatiaceae bacterium]|nr:PD-(D/E)XK nuclease family protein [Candidatus Thioaporhodococcus sediminis]
MKLKRQRLIVTPSRLRSWRRCQKAHDFAYNQGLQRKAPPVPLLRGTILHQLIDAWQTGGDPYQLLEDLAKKYKRILSEEAEYYGDILGDCRNIFDRYVEKYRDDGFEVVQSEYEVIVDLSPTLRFKGHIDKVVKDVNGHLWIQDHKSHANLPDESARFHDLQLLFYVWAWNSSPARQPVEGVIWDYLRTKLPAKPELLKKGGLSKRKNIDTTHAVYYETIFENQLDPNDYADILEVLSSQTDQFFRRVTLPKPPDVMVNQIVEEAILSAEEIQAAQGKMPIRTMNRDCSSCQFQPLCYAELRGLDAPYVKANYYQQREDDDYVNSSVKHS